MMLDLSRMVFTRTSPEVVRGCSYSGRGVVGSLILSLLRRTRNAAKNQAWQGGETPVCFEPKHKTTKEGESMTPNIYDYRDAEVDAARKIRNRQIVETVAGVACAVAGALAALCACL